MKKIVAWFAFLLFLVFQSAAVPSAQADADPCCFPGVMRMVAGTGTGEPVWVSQNRVACSTCSDGWRTTGPYAYVYAGHSSTELWPDTDAFYVPASRDLACGWHASWGWVESFRYRATGWTKLAGETDYCWFVVA